MLCYRLSDSQYLSLVVIDFNKFLNWQVKTYKMKGNGFDVNKMPKTFVCYICGQGFGSLSIGIHIKSCKEKWEKQ